MSRSCRKRRPNRVVGEVQDHIRQAFHAPPGAGYLHLLYMLNTAGKPGEHQREVEGTNRFIKGSFPADFTGARVTLRPPPRSTFAVDCV